VARLFTSAIRGAASVTAAGFTTSGTAPTMGTSPTGGDAILIPYGNTTATRLIRKAIAQPTGVDYWIRVALVIDGTPTASMDLCSIQSGATTWRLRLGTARTVQLLDSASTALGTSAALTINTIAVFDVYWRVVGAASGLWEYRLNGSRIASGSTANLGTAAGTEWVCGKNVATNSGINVYILPEVGVNDGTGAADNSWLGIFVRAASEAISLAATAARTLAFPRSRSEAVSVADTAARTLRCPRAAPETISAADTARRTFTCRRSAVEAVTCTPAAARTVRFPRANAESVSVSDTATRTRRLPRAAGETLSLAAAAARTVAMTRTTAEAVTFTPVAARTLALPRGARESITLADVGVIRTVGPPPIRFPTTATILPRNTSASVAGRTSQAVIADRATSAVLQDRRSDAAIAARETQAAIADRVTTAEITRRDTTAEITNG
jgi:hypothetical protein